MALLQISEPGMAPLPHQSKLAAGIDLGTTHSLVATVRNSIPEVLDDETGRPLLPSVVQYLPDGYAKTGYTAQASQTTDPKNTIVSVKRLMGRGISDITHIENMPYDFVDQPGMVQIRTVAGTKSPVEISAEILATLRQRAEDALGDELVGAVITVPAYFDDAQRQATKDAAKLAGIHVLRLLSEPTAAAIAYGLDNAPEGIYAAYDLGGGTFDISILRLSRGVFEVLATGGDSALGGDDFDHRLFCWIIEQAQLKPLSPEDTRTLMGKAREVKERLSSRVKTRLKATLQSGEHVNLDITAETFEQITHHLVCKTAKLAREALHAAGLVPEDVQGVVLIGGATRMPHVRKEVQKLFGKTPHANIDPEKVVALGAAMQANLLAGNRSPGDDWLLLDVIPLSLGVETMGELVEKIIPRNATIPCTFAQEFTTFKDGQTAMSIHVLQGERELVSDCRSLARFELRGIPPMPAGMPRIRITYQVDADGLLSVSASELHANVEASIVVKPSYGLTDTEIARMLAESGQSAQADMEARMLREAKLEAERIIYATRAALESDAALLSEEERQTIETLLSDMEGLSESTHPAVIHTAVEALAKGTETFAARRMNRNIQQALAGKSIHDIT
ncbi:Fe-S protein assembly chaperone HscA [Oxalobacter vibrioformis]|uniref:Chaperone protein HscA homolog n=1 Tax=Oxalobacter vibrioformis TaxID=933080 RepID=A0A9E9LXA7_9BURK|nr:Fe-S protein assembly chaperone HscA [Oxalobacter vibrioformis]NLC24605.1 Fe-S protein assembly chaperone HscA [Oxalobacter sp.]WAW09310.1 Fe-S protein assembly chaperone HscA [Oxalobacter vibrioformis]